MPTAEEAEVLADCLEEQMSVSDWNALVHCRKLGWVERHSTFGGVMRAISWQTTDSGRRALAAYRAAHEAQA